MTGQTVLSAKPRRLYGRIIEKLRSEYETIRAHSILLLVWTRRHRAEWVLALSGLILGELCFRTAPSSPLSAITVSGAVSTLISLAEILTTILAISVSLLIVSLQFISESYTPRALKTLFQDPLFVGYLAAYTTSISLILASLTISFVPLQTFQTYAVYITLFCIVYLLVLLFRIPNLLHPSYVIQRLTKKVPRQFCEELVKHKGQLLAGTDDEALLGIQQTMIRSIVQNELQSFLTGLRYLNFMLSEFLNKTEKDLNAAENKKDVRESPSYVFDYFLGFYRRMIWESLSYSRQEHLICLCESLENHLIHLHRLKAFRAFEHVAEVYDYGGLTGVDQRMMTFAEYFERSLGRLVTTQMSILDEPIFPFEEPLRRWAELSENERDLQSVRSIMTDFGLRSRFKFLSNLTEAAAVRRLDLTVSYCMFIFDGALDKTLSLQPIGKKRVFTWSVMRALIGTHKKCVQSGINSTGSTTDLLHFKIEKMKDSVDFAEFSHYVTTEYAQMAIVSIENGFYDELFHWGVNGRYLVKDYPNLAMVVIDVLEKGLKTIKPKITRENVGYYMRAREDLKSLRDWDNHSHRRIKNRVNRVLAKYPSIKRVSA